MCWVELTTVLFWQMQSHLIFSMLCILFFFFNYMVFMSFSWNMILYVFFFLVHLQLAEWIKTSSTESDNVSKALCEDISKHCQSTRYVISDNGYLCLHIKNFSEHACHCGVSKKKKHPFLSAKFQNKILSQCHFSC